MKGFDLETHTHTSTPLRLNFISCDQSSVGGNPGLCSKISCKKKKNNVVVPVVASVAGSVFLLAAALAIFFVLKRKRQGVYIFY